MDARDLFPSAPSTWERTTLGEICRRGGGGIQTGPFGSQLHASDYVPIGIPSIMPVNIGDNRIDPTGIARVGESDADRLSKHRVRPGDVIYSRRGDVERRALIRESEDGWLCGTGCLKVRFGDGVVIPAFASFYLGHPEIRAWIVRHAVGATMPNLNTAIMEAVPFLLPPINEQRRIADILGTLDDKIELNRRMNETLEALARRLFRSWFVDFDPVRAKAAVRAEHPKWSNAQISRAALPNLVPEIAELFPDAFEDSTLGPIPKGWTVSTIGEMVTVVGGSTPSTRESSYWGGNIPFATPKDMASLTAPTLYRTERHITSRGLKRISSGLLPAATVLLSSRAPIGYLAISEMPVAVNQGFVAMICDKGVPNQYVLHWARTNMDIIIGNANGTTFLEISKKNFRPIPALRPERQVLQQYVEATQLLHRRVTANLTDSERLVLVRDVLLPKLLSGHLM